MSVVQKNLWLDKCACVVGNGPSAVEHSERIDSCDPVVRMNVWEPSGRAGRAWHIWSGCLENLGIQKRAFKLGFFDALPDELTVWLRPETTGRLCNTGPIRLLGNQEMICLVQYAREGEARERVREVPLQWISAYWFMDWFDARIRERCGQTARVSPTIGLVSLGEALRMRPARLVIVGFDAVSPEEEDTWCDWFGPFNSFAAERDHAYSVEKEIISEWVAERRFCGHEFPETEPVWLRKDSAL